MAARRSSSVDAQSEVILEQFEELERKLSGVNQTLSDIQRINAESEELVEQLCEVFSAA
jgi:hypothetical protein